MHIDLHTHTRFSDGTLSPDELIVYAVDKGIRMLSITDHDTVAAYSAIGNPDLDIIPGIELSTQWQNIGVHIVGLNIDLESAALRDAIAVQNEARDSRARAIGDKLEKQGIDNAYEGAAKIAGNGNIGRPHFAQYLVESGVCDSVNDAFNKYLGAGKSGNIRKFWPVLPEIINAIHTAGGIAVLAHPLVYKLTRTKLSELLDDFINAGGKAMEVISGKQLNYQTQDLAKLCRQKKLLASCGSDFHQPGQGWADIGQFPDLPRQCDPVWNYFN